MVVTCEPVSSKQLQSTPLTATLDVHFLPTSRLGSFLLLCASVFKLIAFLVFLKMGRFSSLASVCPSTEA